MYKVIWEKVALADLERLDRSVAQRIVDKVESYLVKDPINLGKPLLYDYKGNYRYRVLDDWRVIYEIRRSELLIIVVEIGHRSKIY